MRVIILIKFVLTNTKTKPNTQQEDNNNRDETISIHFFLHLYVMTEDEEGKQGERLN